MKKGEKMTNRYKHNWFYYLMKGLKSLWYSCFTGMSIKEMEEKGI